MRSEIRYVTVNGVHLGYQVHSEGSGKPPLVFMHGYSGRSTGDGAYPALLPALAQQFTVYALDMRGHGTSASQIEGFSMTAVADDLAAIVRALGLIGALYVGHSFGGFTGMYCEVRHPGSFSAMCLLTAGPAGGGGFAGPEAGKFLIEHGNDREALRAAFAAMYVHGGDGSENVDAALMMDLSVHRAYFPEWVRLSILDDIRGIRVPVLMLNGALDNIVPLWSLHETAAALPFSKEITFSNEGHMLPRESGNLVAREILAFWRDDVAELPLSARPPAQG